MGQRFWWLVVLGLALPSAVFLLLNQGVALQFMTRLAAPPQGGEVGGLAPAFQLEDLEGRTIALADYRGKVVLVNFWATWCVPCRTEMPEIEAAYSANRERGFEVLAVNLQESNDEIIPYVQELGLSFPALLDRDGSVSRLFRARALPSSFMIDRDGLVRYLRVGALDSATIAQGMRAAGL